MKSIGFSILFSSLLLSCKVAKPYANALINEQSPYLLQHAHNPVNWQAWNKQDKSTDKLLIISIGYSACHWCHVMEQESFSDSSVAILMNQHFVNIKIDREERPDIDNIYMTTCQLTNQNGCGWPLNIIALPDGKPVWIGSYLTKEKWQETLNYFLNVQKINSQKLIQYANHLKEGIEETQKITTNKQTESASLAKMVENIKTDIDFEDGGLIGTPKFPTPNLFGFLLKYESQNPDSTLKKGIVQTLDKIANGGIYDHLEGGFSRYSTDGQWAVPHFEKMLYDNAQLISLYARGSVQNAHYKQIVRQTIAFLEQQFRAKNGGFYASIDADSDGKEGQYYKWTKAEIEQILGNEAAVFFEKFELNDNVLCRISNRTANRPTPRISNFKSHGEPSETTLKILLEARKRRIAPPKDTKIITRLERPHGQGLR
jgi:uncharacterized protein